MVPALAALAVLILSSIPACSTSFANRQDGSERNTLLLTHRRAAAVLDRINDAMAESLNPITAELLLSDNERPIASAIGATQILVTTGMVEVLPSDDELAWVLAHEYAHLTLGHGERRSSRALHIAFEGIGGATMLSPAALLPVSGEFVQPASFGIESRLRRKGEAAADRIGIEVTCRAGYDPKAASNVLRRWQKDLPLSYLAGYLDSHAPYSERIAVIDEISGNCDP